MAMSNKKKILSIAIGISLLGLMIALSLFLIPQTQHSGYIEVPFFGSVSCSPAPGSSVYSSNSLLVPKDGVWLVPPSNTKTWDLIIDYPKIGRLDWFRTIEYTECDDIQRTNCGVPRTLALSVDLKNYDFDNFVVARNFASDKVVFVRTIGFASKAVADGARVKARYLPYVLWNSNFLGGGINPISGSTDCRVPTYSEEWNNAVTSTSINKDWTFYKGQSELRPDEKFNYIVGLVTRPEAGSTVVFNNQEGYCMDNVQGQGTVIYGFSDLTTKRFTYKVVDTGKEIANLGFEGCCVENQVQPGRICKDFLWQNIPDEEDEPFNPECTPILNPCNPGRYEAGDGAYTFEWKCIDGTCQQSNVQEEECISNSDCQGANEICINFECIDASDPLIDVTPELQCSAWQREGFKTVYKYSVLGIKSSPELVPACRMAYWLLAVIIISSILFVLTMVIAAAFITKQIRGMA